MHVHAAVQLLYSQAEHMAPRQFVHVGILWFNGKVLLPAVVLHFRSYAGP
jgi:hypothetical protein